MKLRLQRALLDTLCRGRAQSWLGEAVRGAGAILAGHRVLPDPPPGAFAPNRALAVSPEFLAALLGHLRDRKIAVISLGETLQRLEQGVHRGPAVCFTFDDGYADNYLEALPIFAGFGMPFTVFLTTGFLDGTVTPWWHALEAVIARTDLLTIERDGRTRRWQTRSPAQKLAAYRAVMRWLQAADPSLRSAALRDLADRYGGPPASPMLTWSMAREMAQSTLVEIGCHTVSHPMLAMLPHDEAKRELVKSRRRIEAQIGRPVELLAYPYGKAASVGSRERSLAQAIGFSAAVTTRHATLSPRALEDRFGLPRLPLNGNFQRLDYFDLFLAGTPFLPGEIAYRLAAGWRRAPPGRPSVQPRTDPARL